MDWALTRQPASRHPASPPPRRYKMLARGLVDASATEPHAGQTALIAAAKAGKVNVMRVLLDADAAVDGTDYKGYTALDNAVPQAPPPPPISPSPPVVIVSPVVRRQRRGSGMLCCCSWSMGQILRPSTGA
jgi:hypothetical protein